MKKIITGSRAFFEGMDGFKPHDFDYIVLRQPEEVSFKYKYAHKDSEGNCIFEVVVRDKQDMMDYAVKHGLPMSLCMFLVPEFCEAVGITLSDLPTLSSMRDRLNKRHRYLGIIYNAYLTNGSMTLTEEQRMAAYDEYKKARQ